MTRRVEGARRPGSKRGCKRKDEEGKKKRIRGEEEEKNNKTDLGQVKKR